MTTYRLLNNVFQYSGAYVDFRAIRKQCENLSVEFSQRNESLLTKLKNTWTPVGLEFKSDSKKAIHPDISTWNMSCLVLSGKAKRVLEPLLRDYGELLSLEEGYYLFNCLKSVSGDVVDPEKTAFEIESERSAHIPKSLALLPDKISGISLFKPGFALNTFLICQDDFKGAVESAELGGVLFEENLAQIFPRKR